MLIHGANQLLEILLPIDFNESSKSGDNEEFKSEESVEFELLFESDELDAVELSELSTTVLL